MTAPIIWNTSNLKWRTSRPINKLKIRMKCDGYYLIADGVPIAKTADPETPQAGTWIPLEPGWSVFYAPDFSYIDIRYEPSGRFRL